MAEERQLSEVSEAQIIRIYALTGRFIRDPEIFAIGDLLLKAIKKQTVKVNSPFPVIRSYVSATDVTKYGIKWLSNLEKPRLPIEASTHITTLENLALEITREYGLPSPIIEKYTQRANSYSCSPVLFQSLLKTYNISPMNFKDQIRDTAKGIIQILSKHTDK